MRNYVKLFNCIELITDFFQPKCKRLWCTTTLDEKEGCRTQHMPWADGTPCDKNRWCLRGDCALKNRDELRKIHGQWGAWQR